VRKRTLSREFALKALYQCDVRGEMPEQDLLALAETDGLEAPPGFGCDLARGCIEKRQKLDEIIQETAENWRMDRMPIIDRNILRLAAYRMVHGFGEDPKAVIVAAIGLAKRFGDTQSYRFVNGVLDGLRKRLESEP